MSLRLDWCSHEAAKWAVEHWHYSQNMPHSKLVRVGVWEDDVFKGAIIFGVGATPHLGSPYGLNTHQTCELVRVALKDHKAPVSQIVSIAIRMLKKLCPATKLIVSFADPKQGHVGVIYQAGNWIYTGKSPESTEYFYKGEWTHGRAVSLAVKSTGIARGKLCPKRRIVPGKHRYLMPMDQETRDRVEKSRLPYPTKEKTRTKHSVDAPPVQGGEGGSTPTRALHSS